MKPYIFSILFLFTASISFAQTKEVLLKKSYKVDKNTVLNLDLDNVAIVFEESLDDKIHFDYDMTFINYPERKKEDLLDGVNIKVNKKGNQINLDIKNSMYVGIHRESTINMDSLKVITKKYFIFKKTFKDSHKTKEELLYEIEQNTGSDFDNYISKHKKEYENQVFLKERKRVIKKFIIRAPSYIRIEIKSLHSNITFNYNLEETIILNAFRGDFKFKKLISKTNKFQLINSVVLAKEILGGKYTFKTIFNSKIGFISNSELNTETSGIKIGEIGKNVSINDFSSKIYLYNFHKNFKKFNFYGDYSELNLYKVKETNFSMDVSGFNTNLHMNGIKTSFGASKEKEFTKILQKKRKENSPFLGNIDIELKNGILNIK